MKKLSKKGFTLIELLAVIVIMGILFATAGMAISRIIENSRKDTFINTMKNYVDGAKNMWSADNIRCNVGGVNYVSSAVPSNDLSDDSTNKAYYIAVDSSGTAGVALPNLLESGGKSSWGSREIKGYIKIVVTDVNIAATGEPVNYTRKVNFYPVLSDGVHGVNLAPPASGAADPKSTEIATLVPGDDLVRGNIAMSGIVYPGFPTNVCIEV